MAGWQELNAFLRRWYSDPDSHALELAVCIYISHTYLGQNPVWLFIVGPPGTGKTGVVIKALSYLPNTHVLSEITKSTFLSGKGSKKNSLLHRIGSGVLLFKDFTTLISKRAEDQAEILAQLREIHDGRLTKSVGSADRTLDWAGKITVVAACTPALERAWAVQRELGDRFLAVRWSRGVGEEMSAKARAQIGHEAAVDAELRERILRLVDGVKRAEPPDDAAVSHGDALVEFAAQLRAVVVRDSRSEIIAVNEAEGTPRLIKGLSQLAQARASLMRRPTATREDVLRVQRAVLQSIPVTRLKVIEAIPDGADAAWGEIAALTGLAQGPLQRPLEDLQTLRIIDVIEGHAQKLYKFSDWFGDLKSRAFSTILTT